MNKRKAILLLFFILAILVYSRSSGPAVDASGLPNAEDINGDTLVSAPPVNDAIRSFQDRIRRNPKDAVSYTILGDLYIRQARETGDVSGYQRAEAALSRALELLPGYTPAGALLASTYYARHDFNQALDLAERVYESNPKTTSARVVIGDAYLSLGNYQQAEIIYKELEQADATPPVLARLAQLEELKGNPREALHLLRRAAGDALRSGGTRESVAWYLLRVADIYFNMGEIKDSGAYYEASLRVFENYHLALAGLGKVRAAQGKYDEAIDYYQRAINIVPQPDFLAALGDIYVLTDQPDEAQLQYKTVEYIGKLAELNKQIYNRQLANFYSGHDLHVEQALRLALAELKSRKDIFGYDAAAWAYYRNGKFKEAKSLIDQAMTLGTRDAQLYYHAGMIALRLGEQAQARDYLEQALSINPHFSILYADEARTTFQSLQAMEPR